MAKDLSATTTLSPKSRAYNTRLGRKFGIENTAECDMCEVRLRDQ